MNQKDLSIIIVSWQTRKYLRKCLESIFSNKGSVNIEVIVIDNASTDGTANIIKNEFPQVKLVSNEQNLGFAKANNQGLKIALASYILFLNPDTEIRPQTLTKSLEFFKTHKDAGAVGCQILNTDNSLQLSVRRFPTLWSQFLILYKIHHLFPNLKTFKNYLAKDFDYSRALEVEQIMGSFILTKKEIMEKIGGFDEKFYLWFEEVDLCKRLKNAGYKIYYTPQAQITHFGAQSFNQILNVPKQEIFNKSLRYYFKKHYGFWPWLVLASAHFDSLFLAWLAQFFKKTDYNVNK